MMRDLCYSYLPNKMLSMVITSFSSPIHNFQYYYRFFNLILSHIRADINLVLQRSANKTISEDEDEYFSRLQLYLTLSSHKEGIYRSLLLYLSTFLITLNLDSLLTLLPYRNQSEGALICKEANYYRLID